MIHFDDTAASPWKWHDFVDPPKGKKNKGGGSLSLSHDHEPHHILTGKRTDDSTWGVWIGSRWGVREVALEYDIVLNLTGDSLYSHRREHTIPPEFSKLSKYKNGKTEHDPGWDREIVLDWPNYGVPDLPREFWKDMFWYIQRVPRTLMFCQGGHGRTGTATCLLLLVSRAIRDGDEAIRWLRGNYCEKAVEGKAQVEMVRGFGEWLKG